MTNRDIYRIAMEQSAVDANCHADDFLCGHPVIVNSQQNVGARKYLKWPIECNLISYGTNVVATVEPPYYDIVNQYIHKYDVSHLMETPHMHVLDKAFSAYHLGICFMAEYFLPDLDCLRPLPCSYELRTLHPEDFAGLYD